MSDWRWIRQSVWQGYSCLLCFCGFALGLLFVNFWAFKFPSVIKLSISPFIFIKICFIHFVTFWLGIYILIIPISLWCIETFILLKRSSLTPLIFLALKIYFVWNDYSELFFLWLIYILVFHYFTFNLFLSLDLMHSSYRQHRVDFVFLLSPTIPIISQRLHRSFRFPVSFCLAFTSVLMLLVFISFLPPPVLFSFCIRSLFYNCHLNPLIDFFVLYLLFLGFCS